MRRNALMFSASVTWSSEPVVMYSHVAPGSFRLDNSMKSSTTTASGRSDALQPVDSLAGTGLPSLLPSLFAALLAASASASPIN